MHIHTCMYMYIHEDIHKDIHMYVCPPPTHTYKLRYSTAVEHWYTNVIAVASNS